MSTRLRRTRSIPYTTRATNSTLAQPFSPVLRSVAHIKPIDKSQSSSFSDSLLLIVPSASTQVRPLLRHTASLHACPHERAPETSIDFAPPRTPCVAYIQHPRGGLFHLVCEAQRGLAERLSRMERAGPEGGGGGSSPPRCRPPTLAVARIFIPPPPCPCSSTNPSRASITPTFISSFSPMLHMYSIPEQGR